MRGAEDNLLYTQGYLTVLAILVNGNTWSSLYCEALKRDGDGFLIT